MTRWICDSGTLFGAFQSPSSRSRARGRTDVIIEEFSRKQVMCSVMSSCVFFFAWQVMAEGRQSASAAQARSWSGSKHVGQWLVSKVLDK